MASTDHKTPLWVSAFATGGRPTVAVIVMAMCAPGEHHLAVLAGWTSHLAWGMAAVMAAYAGIAAVVATKRPKGAPGKHSAVWGACISLIAAMAAQPVSHLFVTGWLSAQPRAPWLLVIAVSCVPPLTLGHLLHLAATPLAHHDQPSEQPEHHHAQRIEHPPEQPKQPMLTAAAPTPTGLLTAEDVMRILGCSRSTVTRWQNKGFITVVAKDAMGANLYAPMTNPVSNP